MCYPWPALRTVPAPLQSTVANITARKDAEIASMRSQLEGSQAALAEAQAQLEQAQATVQVLPSRGDRSCASGCAARLPAWLPAPGG